MYVACSSQSYDDALGRGALTLPEWIRLCAEELGLAAVELEDKHIGEPTPERLDEVRAAVARHRVEIVNIALMNNFGLADPAARRAEVDRTLAWMGVAQRIGSRYLRTFAGWPEGDRAERWPAMIASLRSAVEGAERAGVRLVMENHNHNGFVQTADDVVEIFDSVRSPALGLLLDTGNFLDGIRSIERTAALARHVHAKFTEVTSDGRNPHVDHDAVLGLLRRAGYEGCVSLEYEGREPGRTAVPRALAHLRRATGS